MEKTSMLFSIPKLIRLDITDSTNKEAFRLLTVDELEEGSVITASYQVSGRGHGESSWESEAGKNLLFSIILKPEFLPPSRQFRLNQAVALGILEGISAISGHDGFCIKWPNDIYFQKGKISGMLIENSIMGEKFMYSVAGIGINLNQEVFLSNAPNPVSLSNITKKNFDVYDSLLRVVDKIMYWYQKLKSGQVREIEKAYHTNLLGYQSDLLFSDHAGVFTGKIMGVDKHGRLVINTLEGRKVSYELKQVRFVL
ncbi:MAG TPA: biotin--[acetyl-CoA-carboxylase] ligase [Bacteroidales bacterium]|nr:biotin--[acetyl-CoA-carboxylase] ligase [Bacteroidales bacterium]